MVLVVVVAAARVVAGSVMAGWEMAVSFKEAGR